MLRSRILLLCILVALSASTVLFAQPVSETGDLPEEGWQLVEQGTTWLDLFPGVANRANLDETVTEFDPGTDPEGDFMGQVAFSTDGARVLLTNRVTNNISVYNVENMELLENISVGNYPCYIACTDEYAIVPCAFADSVWIIDLDDYSTAAIIPTGEQPWIVHVTDDGARALVATDIDNTLEVIDLENLTLLNTIENVPFSLISYSWNSESGRNMIKFLDFLYVPGTEHVMFSNREEAIWIYDFEGGELADSITGLANILAMAVSGDGSTLIAANSENSTATAYQIDLETYAITDSAVCTGHSLSTYQIGVNDDGSKCYLGVGGNVSAMIDFTDNDITYFDQTYTAFWIGVNADHSHVVSGQYRFSILDFDTESILGSYWGYSQWTGTVSPVDEICVGLSPLTDEVMYVYDFTNPASITFDNSLVAGENPEADGPRRVAITSDGSLAVATHVISDNATIIDLETMETLVTLYIGDRVQDVAITPDDAYAVICGFNSNNAHIIDLDLLMQVTTVPCGQRPMCIAMDPDGEYAYISNVSDNTITFIALDGANSSAVGTVACGTIGVNWSSYGVGSQIAVTPDGEYLLVCASFDDVLKVIDTDTRTVVATVPTGDFPLQVAINDASTRAVVTNNNDYTYSYIELDGASSNTIGTYGVGAHPLRVAYDGFNERFLIGDISNANLYYVDEESGAVSGSDSYAAYGAITGVAVDDFGDAVVMTAANGDIPGMVHKGDVHSEYPGSAAMLAYQPDADIAAVPVPGPDWITFVQYDAVNHPPSHFALLEPEDFDTVTVDMETLNFYWEESVDLDPGDEVHYTFEVDPVNAGSTLVVEDLTDTTYMMDPYVLEGLVDNPNIFQPFWWRVLAISGEDTVECDERFGLLLEPPIWVDDDAEAALPTVASITDAYPNPFNSTVTIRFGLPSAGTVKMTVFDVLGREVTSLLNQSVSAGHHILSWEAGATLPSGMYWIRLEAGTETSLRRVTLIK